VIAYWLEKYSPGRLRHVWHPDEGFRKNKILNQAIASSFADYLIMLDGDCLMSPGVVYRHLAMARTGAFISSGVVRLPGSAGTILSRDLIAEGVVFKANWLVTHAPMRFQDRLKLGNFPPIVVSLMEILSPVKRTWNGGHSSAWRRDLITVNGYDETMKYGGEDIELGYRLNNAGIRGRHLRYSTLVLHIDHARGYVDEGEIAKNRLIIRKTRQENRIRTTSGIEPQHNA
jgi:GT2 family glycosyltransferase